MKLHDRTILMTGGTSGMGFELAKRLLDPERRNTVIVTGRSDEKLEAAKRALPGVHAFRSDMGDPAAIVALGEHVLRDFPALDTLINNAGIMRVQKFNQDQQMDDITGEIEICFSGSVRMVQQFMPKLRTRKDALLVNVSAAGKHEVRPGRANAMTIMSRTASDSTLIQIGKMIPAFGNKPSAAGAVA